MTHIKGHSNTVFLSPSFPRPSHTQPHAALPALISQRSDDETLLVENPHLPCIGGEKVNLLLHKAEVFILLKKRKKIF